MRIKIIVSCIALTTLFPLFILNADIDLDSENIYVRKGFDKDWIHEIPDPDDDIWLTIPPAEKRVRSVVLKDLPLEEIPQRRMFSLKKQDPRNFTFISSFSLTSDKLAEIDLPGVYFQNIGENWEIFINGKLLKSELHLDENGRIAVFRHWRNVLVPVDPRILKVGENIIAVRIVGDPANIDSGFHRSTPFIIDDLATLEDRRSETATLILIFLYLFFGLYHLFLYAKKPSERHYFFYGAFSVILFIYMLSRTTIIYQLIPDSTILHRIEYASLYALIPLFGAFVDLLLAGRYSSVTKIFGVFYSLLIAITLTPVSNTFAIDILRVWQTTSIIPLFYYAFIRIGKPVAKDYNQLYKQLASRSFPVKLIKSSGAALGGSMAGKLMIGALIMLGCTIFDILDSMFWHYDYVLSTYGFFAFTLGISLILADRFIDIHNKLENTNSIINLELEIASHVQRSLLPVIPDSLEEWDIAVDFSPLYGPSGDFYDIYFENGKLRGISLFDVSGHGISSALITMILKPVTFRAFNRMKDESLDKTVDMIGRQLSEGIPASESLISCIILRFSSDYVEYVNAGHPDLILKNGKTGSVDTVGNDETYFRSAPLGIDIPEKDPGAKKLKVNKNDVLLLYTDGLFERVNSTEKRYGTHCIENALKNAPEGSSSDILKYLMNDSRKFNKRSADRDDITVIVAQKIRA